MATHRYLTLLNSAIAGLEATLSVIEPDGEPSHPAWTTLAELRQAAKNLQEREILFSWDVDDVLAVRDDLTFDQAAEVLAECESCHDAGLGMNWNQIQFCADSLYPTA